MIVFYICVINCQWSIIIADDQMIMCASDHVETVFLFLTKYYDHGAKTSYDQSWSTGYHEQTFTGVICCKLFVFKKSFA